MSVCGLAPAALVANSFGCQIVTQLALDHPDLIDRLVLQGPTGDPCMRTSSRMLVCLCRDWWCEPPSLVWISLTDYGKAGLPRVLRTFRHQLEDQVETRLPGIEAPTLVDRTSVVSGKSVAVTVDLGGRET